MGDSDTKKSIEAMDEKERDEFPLRRKNFFMITVNWPAKRSAP